MFLYYGHTLLTTSFTYLLCCMVKWHEWKIFPILHLVSIPCLQLPNFAIEHPYKVFILTVTKAQVDNPWTAIYQSIVARWVVGRLGLPASGCMLYMKCIGKHVNYLQARITSRGGSKPVAAAVPWRYWPAAWADASSKVPSGKVISTALHLLFLVVTGFTAWSSTPECKVCVTWLKDTGHNSIFMGTITSLCYCDCYCASICSQ